MRSRCSWASAANASMAWCDRTFKRYFDYYHIVKRRLGIQRNDQPLPYRVFLNR